MKREQLKLAGDSLRCKPLVVGEGCNTLCQQKEDFFKQTNIAKANMKQ